MTTIRVATLALTMFLLGCAAGSFSSRPTVNSVNEWMDKQPLSAQHDFLEARLKFLPGVRRQLAEDWCATNADTQGVCHRARNHAAPVNTDTACHRADVCPTTAKHSEAKHAQ